MRSGTSWTRWLRAAVALLAVLPAYGSTARAQYSPGSLFTAAPGQGAAGGVGDGTLTAPSPYTGGPSAELIAAGGFNGDSVQGLAALDRSSKWIHTMLGQGTGGIGDCLTRRFSYPLRPAPQFVTTDSIPCAPPSCSFSAGALTWFVSATRYDTTFSSGSYGTVRGAYDLAQGWVFASANGPPPTRLVTTTNDTYWVAGVPVGPLLIFHASLQVVVHRAQNCPIPFACSAGYGLGSIAEPGVPATTCPGVSDPCVFLAHRAFEPFRLSVSATAGISGDPFFAWADATSTLRFSGLPPGAYVTSCSGYISGPPVPVQLSLVRTSVESGIARLTWHTPDNSAARATVYRRTGSEDWSRQGEITADGSGYLVYEDDTVISGRRYGYRLGVLDGGEERHFGEAWVEIPFAARLALDEVAPNPATGPIHARFSLPAARPARLEVFDLSGRRVLIREVGAFGSGSHDVVLEDTRALRPGIYMLSLFQDTRRVTKRVMKIR